MATLKCKMCGGDLNIEEGTTVAVCEYCGTKQTVPSADDDKKMSLYQRAHKLRFRCEFDKAAGVYESIIADFENEAEAYWGLVLCKYGIEYVDDPASGKKVPTCHRSSFDSIFDDSDFEQVLENSDPVARNVYREEAKKIEELRKSIIEVSGKEEPYDIFICYKETDEDGDRTVDSLIAQDVYDALTEKGYRVFFSRISLEDKLGQEYEPYIFAALNSAKIMLAFGTDYEYYNSVWVKNEWSRFLKLIAKGEKKTLIPCYKGIDAYDIPKEFAKLQAQDMGKVGAIQDLLRGIEKLLPKGEINNGGAGTQSDHGISQTATVDTLLKRAYMYLEDSDWKNAEDYCNRVLDIVPENAHAYIGKLMAENHVTREDGLRNLPRRLDNNTNFKRAMTYADADTAARLTSYDEATKALIAQKEAQLQNVAGKIRETISKADADIKKSEDMCAAYMAKINNKRNGEFAQAEKLFNEKQIEVNRSRSAITERKARNRGTVTVSVCMLFLSVCMLIPAIDSAMSYGSLDTFPEPIVFMLFIITLIISVFTFASGKSKPVWRAVGIIVAYIAVCLIVSGILAGFIFNDYDYGYFGVVSDILIFNLLNIFVVPKKRHNMHAYKKSCAEFEKVKSQYDITVASLRDLEAKLEKSENDKNALLSKYKKELGDMNNEYLAIAKDADVTCEALIPARYL